MYRNSQTKYLKHQVLFKLITDFQIQRHGSEPLDLRPNCNGENEMEWSVTSTHGSVISPNKTIHPCDYDDAVIHPDRQMRTCDYQDMDPMSPATPRRVMGLPKSLASTPALTARYSNLGQCYYYYHHHHQYAAHFFFFK